jgi:competence protein ComEA
MFKKIMFALTALFAAAAFAAVDANKATQAELESVKGIGPSISTTIVNERKKGEFNDWNDFVTRVKGIGDRSAARLSGGGLTVGGKGFAGAPTKAGATKAVKPGPAGKAAAHKPIATASGAPAGK